MFGIEKLKMALTTIVAIGLAVEERVSDDGKLKWLEVVGLIPTLWGVKKIISDAKEIWQEMGDIDAAEREQLILHVEMLIPESLGHVEELSEKGFKVLLGLQSLGVDVMEFVDAIKAAKQDNE